MSQGIFTLSLDILWIQLSTNMGTARSIGTYQFSACEFLLQPLYYISK